MIFLVGSFNALPSFFVDQDTCEKNPDYKNGVLIVGTLENAQTHLENSRKQVLESESLRFSICSTFVDGNHTTWRAVLESDPEDTKCQVLNIFTGKYDFYPTKTEAINANKELQEEFLKQCGLDEVKTLDELP